MLISSHCRLPVSWRKCLLFRGMCIDHATVQRWVIKFVNLIDKKVRQNKKVVGKSWRMDETYIKVRGEWVYLYRAVDSLGKTIDFLLRKHRDKAAVKAFFRKAFKQHGRPDKVTIDKSGSNLSALTAANSNLPKDQQIEIRQIKYLNNIIEQDHRFIKKRTKLCLDLRVFVLLKLPLPALKMLE